MNPYAVRDRINQRIMSIDAPVISVSSITNQFVHNTPIRIYRPNEQSSLSVILLIHGGAWVAGNLDTHDNLARYLCHETNATVVSVGYRNAPEGKFPYPLQECYDVLLWTAKTFSAPVAVVGDSAGGNLTAALCLMARDLNGPKIILQVLINPATDLTINNEQIEWQASQYLPHLDDRIHPYASPLLAKDLSNLPPALILLAEKDELRESGQKYADRLEAVGNHVQVYCQQGIGHLAGDGARASHKARESLDIAVKELRLSFHNSL